MEMMHVRETAHYVRSTGTCYKGSQNQVEGLYINIRTDTKVASTLLTRVRLATYLLRLNKNVNLLLPTTTKLLTHRGISTIHLMPKSYVHEICCECLTNVVSIV